MRKISLIFLRLLILSILVYSGLLLFLLSKENNIMYWGRNNTALMMHTTPANFKEHTVQVQPNNFLQYYEKSVNPKAPLVVYLGGNGEHANLNLQWLNIVFPQNDVVAINYPSYGESTGPVGEPFIKPVLLEAIQKISQQRPLIIVGRSLGTGYATWLTTQLPQTQKLILITPYNRISEVGCQRFAIFPDILCNHLMQNQLDSGALIPQIHIPTLVIYADGDRTVPNENTFKFLTHTTNAKVVKVLGSNHNSLLDSPTTKQAILQFNKP